MADEGRLELDDDGCPVDSGSSELVVKNAPERPSRASRVLELALTGGSETSGAGRLIGAGVVVALVAALAIATQSGTPAPHSSDVRGISARVRPPDDASAALRILASYSVTAPTGSPASRIVALAGAGIAAAVETSSSAATQSFLVEPDCRRVLASTDGSAYELVLAAADDRSATTTVAAFDGADALRAASVRACWGSVASRGLRPISVSARPGRGPWTDLDVLLRNATGLAVSVTAVDVANVDTISMADSRPIDRGAATILHVRLPISRCQGIASAPASLSWSVGSPGQVPTAFAITPLTIAQRRRIAAAAVARCGAPPELAVAVLRATATRDDASVDDRGVSVSLRVRVSTTAQSAVILGDDGAGLTSDARPAFTGVTVPPGTMPRDAVVVWHTRCGSASDGSRLPANTVVGGLTYAWSVPLAGRSLPALRAAVCG